MAGETYSNINAALSVTYSMKMTDQVNRQAVGLKKLRAVPGDSGKSVNWNVKFTNSKTAASYADGADVDASEYGTNKKESAIIQYGRYRCPASVTDDAAIYAANSLGNPRELMRLLDNEINDSLTTLAKKLNQDLYIGDGTDGSSNPTIVGFHGAACLNSGSYAGLARGTYSEWAGNVLGNGSVARPLTDDLLRQAEQQAWEGGGSKPNMILTTGGVHRKYAGLFGSIQRVQTAGQSPVVLAMGTNDLMWSNMPVERDADAPTGKLVMFNTDDVELVYPSELDPLVQEITLHARKLGKLKDGEEQFVIPVVIEELARTGNAVKVNVWTLLQLRVRRPNATAIIEDISES